MICPNLLISLKEPYTIGFKIRIKKDLTDIKGYDGGLGPKMSQIDKDRLLPWQMKEIKALIKQKPNVVKSSDVHIRRILRSLDLLYIKPHPIDHRKPENAKQ
ncbi:MAG: hypothetical protein NZ901_03005 [Geminocystis sp.]|nr:hypothetical protein [Geminocystis sp.]HIK37226.1 hypothetical protein [Geminocystis sp. M7585_C2015_104]MCS7147141.1 hypothetical protein [Geminocystis sp.]MCX8079110.1 hypothetical protein [Geminocystis sp.]MDW8116777.1 hypothetical protein [Geminocystis sp.]